LGYLFLSSRRLRRGRFGRIYDETTRRRDDETTSTRPRPTAVATKATKFTKHHKEDLVSLFEWLSPLAGPRFARWQE
jgi:hypothetical protein